MNQGARVWRPVGPAQRGEGRDAGHVFIAETPPERSQALGSAGALALRSFPRPGLNWYRPMGNG
eukprot:4567686-Alexandrium_andersonii.AAC.1